MPTRTRKPRTGPTPQPKGGSRKGCPNKSTSLAREAVARFVDHNTERLQGWLDEIARIDGPKAAYGCVLDLMEYHLPKMARTEITGAEGENGPKPIKIAVTFVNKK